MENQPNEDAFHSWKKWISIATLVYQKVISKVLICQDSTKPSSKPTLSGGSTVQYLNFRGCNLEIVPYGIIVY